MGYFDTFLVVYISLENEALPLLINLTVKLSLVNYSDYTHFINGSAFYEREKVLFIVLLFNLLPTNTMTKEIIISQKNKNTEEQLAVLPDRRGARKFYIKWVNTEDYLKDNQIELLKNFVSGEHFKNRLTKAYQARHRNVNVDREIQETLNLLDSLTSKGKTQKKEKEEKERKIFAEEAEFKNKYELETILANHTRSKYIILSNGWCLGYNYLSYNDESGVMMRDPKGWFEWDYPKVYKRLKPNDKENANEALNLLNWATFPNVETEQYFMQNKVLDEVIEKLKNIAGRETKKISLNIE